MTAEYTVVQLVDGKLDAMACSQDDLDLWLLARPDGASMDDFKIFEGVAVVPEIQRSVILRKPGRPPKDESGTQEKRKPGRPRKP